MASRREIFQSISALDIAEDQLHWIWAVMEQEKLWLEHDAYWVDCAKNGWRDETLSKEKDDPIYGMLSSYGLLRGEHGSLLSKVPKPKKAEDDPTKETARKHQNERRKINRRHFANLAQDYAAKLTPDDAKANTEVWMAFGHEFFKRCHGYQKGTWFMPSATLKAMWFHRPELVPMYDQLAARGLARLKKRRAIPTPPSDFLQKAYFELDQSREEIAKARRLLDSTYPYDVRILDKLLWLRGNADREEILRRFKLGCQRMAGQ